jgi:branched-subunit amino acid transport protein
MRVKINYFLLNLLFSSLFCNFKKLLKFIFIMERHINVVAALQIGLSVLGILIGLFVFIVLHLTGDFVSEFETEKILTVIANVILVVITVLCIPGIIAGIGLFKRKKWGRILTLIISVLDLFNFPLGTAVGVYSIWALVQPEIEEQFK